MIERRPLGTGPRPATPSAPTPSGRRGLLAAELAAVPEVPVVRADAVRDGRRPLGPGHTPPADR
ncbi:hypothetical protein WDV06_26510 [Streptomyces racemochromogenes]|uniref:Uncharacterized protein n=1 Tax=Streptomyces racemochromogenes TaxID=67353 RepID=A0ABW7PL15_9ACTN